MNSHARLWLSCLASHMPRSVTTRVERLINKWPHHGSACRAKASAGKKLKTAEETKAGLISDASEEPTAPRQKPAAFFEGLEALKIREAREVGCR